MNRLISNVVLILTIFNLSTQKPLINSNCLNYVQKLAFKDKCLSSRLDLKLDTARSAQNPGQFFTSIKKNQQKCNGTTYSCGNTMSWVSEVFLGLSVQYDEYKNGFQGPNAGYKNLIGNDLKSIFVNNRYNPGHIIYQIRHNGTEDHVWLIEQLPKQQGYIIYQSYNGAYSLKAWLSNNLTGLYQPDNTGDIMVFNKVKEQVNGLLQTVTQGAMNINSDLESANLPPMIQQFKPFIKYVRDYNLTTAINNFERAWNKYGKSKPLDWNTFSNYVELLSEMTSYLSENANKNTLFSEKIFNDWIDMFGSPNPVHFINLPNNAVTNFIFQPVRGYDFQVKTTIVGKTQNCEENYKLLNKYL